MEKYIYDENNGLWYELQGDYYIPCLTLPVEKEERHIGVWGQRRKHFLQEHKRALYRSLLISGKLQSHLADIEEQAQNMFLRLVEEMADCEGITEKLKAKNQPEWVGRMNAVHGTSAEIINSEFIFVVLKSQRLFISLICTSSGVIFR